MLNIKLNHIQVWGPKYKWQNTVHYVDKGNNIIQNVNKIFMSIYILNRSLLITRWSNKSLKDESAGCFWIAFIEYVLWFKIILGLNFITIMHSHIKAKKLKRNLVFRVLFLCCVVIDKNNGKKGPKLLPCKRVKQFYQLDNKCHLF